VDIGIRLPFAQPHAGEAVLEVARAAEDAGMHSAWFGDHIAFPAGEYESVNPTSANGKYARSGDAPVLDAWTMLTYAAAATTQLHVVRGLPSPATGIRCFSARRSPRSTISAAAGSSAVSASAGSGRSSRTSACRSGTGGPDWRK
jgi:Luciferase-like monooxygenase